MNDKNTAHAGIEVLTIFTAIMGVLWLLPRSIHLPLFTLLFIVMIISWRKRGDTSRDLGFIPKNLNYVWATIIFTVFSVATLAAVGWILNDQTLPMSPSDWEHRFSRYLIWALFQQTLAQGYFTHRLYQATRSRKKASIYSGLLFTAIHFPNPMLMTVGVLLGPVAAWVFLENRHIYVLALAHSAIGAALSSLSPLSWYSMRVGPGFF